MWASKPSAAAIASRRALQLHTKDQSLHAQPLVVAWVMHVTPMSLMVTGIMAFLTAVPAAQTSFGNRRRLK